MGTFKTKLRVWNPAEPGKVYEPEVWVDTGAAFSWISRARLEAMGIGALRKMQFRTIEGHIVERSLAGAYIGVNEYIGPDTLVMAEPTDSEVMGAHSIEGLGLAADPVQKKLVPSIMLALAVRTGVSSRRVVTAIDAALAGGNLVEPFSNGDFRRACPGFAEGTYNAFLWKHRLGNGKTTELFDLIAPNQFKRIR
jgi:predicted aspartyl protease